MKQRYFLYLSFDGTAYHGWQIQPNGISVQETLQKCLSTLLRTETEVVGAGRTDAGVHARLMVAHFDAMPIDNCNQLTYKLNRMLPRDISVSRIEEVQANMHARFSAISRTYHYYVHELRVPFLRHYSVEMPYNLDFLLMNKAAEHLLHVNDFGAFCKTGTDSKTTLCTVTEAQWVQIDDGESQQWCFIITANRFLRNMVRAVVGTLVEVGRGRMSVEQFHQVVASGNRSNAGESMPGKALFLWDVKY